VTQISVPPELKQLITTPLKSATQGETHKVYIEEERADLVTHLLRILNKLPFGIN